MGLSNLSARTAEMTPAATPPPMIPTPTLKSLTIARLSEVSWVTRTPSDQITSAS
jgi:hypothetical protein